MGECPVLSPPSDYHPVSVPTAGPTLPLSLSMKMVCASLSRVSSLSLFLHLFLPSSHKHSQGSKLASHQQPLTH